MNNDTNSEMYNDEYTMWFTEVGSKRKQCLTEKEMRVFAQKWGFDPELVIEDGECFIWHEGVEPYDNPSDTSDDIIGGCFKTTFEYVLYYYNLPSWERYKSTYESDWRPVSEVFDYSAEGWDKAWKEAKELASGGAWEVSLQLDELTEYNDGHTPAVETFCPYFALGINQELQELEHQKEQVEEKYFWAQEYSQKDAEGYLEELNKIKAKIEKEPAHE
jgi:hypothetical protein